MAKILGVVASLALFSLACAANDDAACASADGTKKGSIGQSMLQAKSQLTAQSQRQVPAEAPTAAAHCPLPEGAKWCEVRLDNLPAYWMAVYDYTIKSDWVSQNICTTGFWDQRDPSQFGKPGNMLDIGGNIGYFSLLMAHAGWTVTTFEPMAPNLAILNASLCLNPHLAERVKVVPFGLGPTPQKCKMFAPADNLGDGHVACGNDLASGFSNDPNSPAYIQKFNVQEVGQFEIQRLDQLLQQHAVGNIDFVKIDVEGYESQVLASAPNLLTQYKPRVTKLEVWNASFGFSGTHFLQQFEAAGYQFFSDSKCTLPTDAKALVLNGLWEGFACLPGER